MKRFRLISLVSLTLLALACSDVAIAQTQDNAPPSQTDAKPAPQKPEPAGPTDNQIANDVDARIAKLKADLRLTPSQETNWPLLETTLHDYAVAQFKRMMADRTAHHDRDEHPNDIAIMRDEADRLIARADSLKKLASAADPLYGSLDEPQRHRLAQFMNRTLAYDAR